MVFNDVELFQVTKRKIAVHHSFIKYLLRAPNNGEQVIQSVLFTAVQFQSFYRTYQSTIAKSPSKEAEIHK